MSVLRPNWMLAGVVSVVLIVNPAAGDTVTIGFEQNVRLLLQMQDRMAAGHSSAVETQREIIANLEKRFGSGGHPPEATTANAKAALSYVLSGGPPGIASKLAKDEKLAELHKRLLAAAVHFKQGDEKEAQKLLSHIEPLLLPPDIAGRVALMQAMLVPDSDGEKKLLLLSRAMQLMPGTLVEEAALRRSVSVAAKQTDQFHTWQLADKYLRRFGNSLFARDFTIELVALALAAESRTQNSNRNKLELLMNRLPMWARRQCYLLLAKLATQNGLTGLAQFGARRARRLSAEGGSEWQRSVLYDAIHGMAEENYSVHLAQLRSLDPRLLDESEQPLLRAALAVAEQIRAPGKVDEDNSAELDRGALPPEFQALMARGAQELSAADSMIRSLDADKSKN